MPEPTHPPYESGAVTVPRQLERWLDINPQNGSLTRTRKYLLIPAFQVSNINWRGFSEIIAEFHVTASNNFSLRDIPVQSDPSYTLCVAYVDANNNSFRYRLWSAEAEVVYFNVPQYEGQFIAENFKLEIWSTNVIQITQGSSVRIDTSVLGSVDYRFGTDQQLVAFTDPCVGQQYPIDPNNNEFDLPFMFNVCGVTGGDVIIIGGAQNGIVIGGA